MKKLFTILSFHFLMILITFLVSCNQERKEKPNLFGFESTPIVIDYGIMYQMNESGNLTQTIDSAANGSVINYVLHGDTLLASIKPPKNPKVFQWNAIFDVSSKNTYCEGCNSFIFTAKNKSVILFHEKDKKIVAVELRNESDKVIFLSK